MEKTRVSIQQDYAIVRIHHSIRAPAQAVARKVSPCQELAWKYGFCLLKAAFNAVPDWKRCFSNKISRKKCESPVPVNMLTGTRLPLSGSTKKCRAFTPRRLRAKEAGVWDVCPDAGAAPQRGRACAGTKSVCPCPAWRGFLSRR